MNVPADRLGSRVVLTALGAFGFLAANDGVDPTLPIITATNLDDAARRIGMSRREFLRTSMASAATLLAIGPTTTNGARFSSPASGPCPYTG